jgi:hypothetical protein
MIISHFKTSDLAELVLQPNQEYMQCMLEDPVYADYLKSIESYTARDNGVVVACGGFASMSKQRVTVWALIADRIGPSGMVKLNRAVKRGLDSRLEHRIEAIVAANFPQSIRWVKMHGFKQEAIMKKYTDTGEDCLLFARVK